MINFNIFNYNNIQNLKAISLFLRFNFSRSTDTGFAEKEYQVMLIVPGGVINTDDFSDGELTASNDVWI